MGFERRAFGRRRSVRRDMLRQAASACALPPRRCAERPALDRPASGGSAMDGGGANGIIPIAIGQGKNGDFLRKLGISADHLANLLPSRELINAHHDAAIARQAEFVERVNANLPSGTMVAPYAMLPWRLWKGPFAQLLTVACEFSPAQPWNTMLLAKDESSSLILDLPVRPANYPPHLRRVAERHMAKLRGEFERAHAKATRRLRGRDMEMGGYEDALEHLKARIIALANRMAAMALGEDAYNRHLLLFGKTLGWEHSDKILKKRG